MDAAPDFTSVSPVFFDELDPNGHLHNTRFALHVERATTLALAARGLRIRTVHDRHEDLRYVVRQFSIEFLASVGAGTLAVELWLEHLGRTSARWLFQCRSPDGTMCAKGSRTLVKVDGSGRPAEWSQAMRSAFPAAQGTVPRA